jgi:hypothetical protein
LGLQLLKLSAPLLKAHQQLDRAVDRCYQPEPFASDRHRAEYLFALYEQLTARLVAAEEGLLQVHHLAVGVAFQRLELVVQAIDPLQVHALAQRLDHSRTVSVARSKSLICW